MDPKWKVLLQSVFLVLQKNEPITNNEFQTYEKIIPQECSNAKLFSNRNPIQLSTGFQLESNFQLEILWTFSNFEFASLYQLVHYSM